MVQTRLSVAYMNRTNPYNHNYHPGFAWAFQRKWFRDIGFYKEGITGSGDTMSTAAWMNIKFPRGYVHQSLVPSYEEYSRMAHPNLACSTGTIYHLWHGSAKNRKYVDRHRILDGVRDVRSILETNKDGVLELTDRDVDRKMREYFASREDDGIS
jgi:hypothetical protein